MVPAGLQTVDCSKMNKKVVFIGCGSVATPAALKLQSEGVNVLGVRRNISGLPAGLPALAADVLNPSDLDFLKNTDATTIVYSLAAGKFDEQSYLNAYVTGLRNTIEACNFSRIKRLIFVSSTAVYHQNDGSLVDELSTTEPQRFNGCVMLQAEQLALATGVGTALRHSGIYGPGRLRMIDRVRNGQCTNEGSTENTASYSNRIHAEDCAGVIAHLVNQDTLPEIILGSDSLPATTVEIESFIADQLGIDKQYAAPSGNQPKRIAGSKRCDNSLLLKTGYRFIHPDYRSGYKKLIAAIP